MNLIMSGTFSLMAMAILFDAVMSLVEKKLYRQKKK